MDPVYTTAAELRADPDVPDDLDDARAVKLINSAEDLVDRLVGPGVGFAGGRKLEPARLTADAREALSEVTTLLAAEEYADPAAFLPPAGRSISGPEFSVSDVAGNPAGIRALERAAAILDAHRLRSLGGRLR